MSGLREQQKEMRRAAISRAAIELFESKGYEKTTVEQIAKQAGVTAPTVFNYFGSKQAILLEMVRETDKRAISEACQHLSEYEDPLDAMCQLEDTLISLALESLSVTIWREILPMVLSGRNKGFTGAYLTMNEHLQSEIAKVLDGFRQEGKLRDDLDVMAAAKILNEYSHLQFFQMVSSDSPDREQHRQRMREMTAIMLRGMESR